MNDQTQDIPSLATKALLVQLTISQWAARKLDKRATSETNFTNNADQSAGRYNKSLLPNAASLKAVQTKSAEIRTWFYAQTLAWGVEGTMLLPSKNYMQFMRDYDQHKTEWETLVDNFLVDYYQAQQNAQNLLGSLYRADDYPSTDQVKKKFGINLVVLPVPSTDFRVQVGETERRIIVEGVESRLREANDTAMRDLWSRLYGVVSKLAGTLQQPDKIFRDSLVENVREACAILPGLNLSDDPTFTNMTEQVKNLLRSTPSTLRENPTARQDTATQAQSIMDQMGAFMG